jgi:hypothetical protein
MSESKQNTPNKSCAPEGSQGSISAPLHPTARRRNNQQKGKEKGQEILTKGTKNEVRY